ncbi:hypothetical protein [Furfurilactobacillus cerevisiae]
MKWSRILTALTVLGLSFGLAACANKKGNRVDCKINPNAVRTKKISFL